LNTPNYREIEKKWLVVSRGPYSRLETRFVDWYLKQRDVPPDKILFAETIDDYWFTPYKGQFMRIRHSWGAMLNGEKKVLKELTAKSKDKGGNLNRFEANVEIDSVVAARAALSVALGPPLGRIRKVKEAVVWDGDVVVSLAELKDGRMWVEVEGPTVASLREHEDLLNTMFALEREKKNLFELYIQGE
jgi:hypothetical protein